MKLSDIDNNKKLSQFLRLDFDALDGFLKNGIDNHCNPMYLPKRNPSLGYRTVYKVNSDKLLNIHKVFHSHLNSVYQPLEPIHGYVPNRNTTTNASKHLAKKYVLTVDLENFFESVPYDSIFETLKSLGANDEIAKSLISLLTLNNKLVQGFICSPVLSNMCIQSMDQEILDLSKEHDFVYTRYADDITISSDNRPSIKLIEDVINKKGYKLNPKKIKLARRGRKQYVTGLTVFDSESPRIPKRFKKRLRLELYYLKKYGVNSFIENSEKYNGVSSEAVRNSIKGWIDYVNAVEPQKALEYMKDFEEIEKKDFPFKQKKFESEVYSDFHITLPIQAD